MSVRKLIHVHNYCTHQFYRKVPVFVKSTEVAVELAQCFGREKSAFRTAALSSVSLTNGY